jgi:hypothetical protein
MKNIYLRKDEKGIIRWNRQSNFRKFLDCLKFDIRYNAQYNKASKKYKWKIEN